MALKKKKNGKKGQTIGQQLDELSDAQGRESLKLVDGWFAACLAQMKHEARARNRRAEIEVHSVEEGPQAGTYEAFKAEFAPAAEALKRKLEADKSLRASYDFRRTEAQTIDGGMEQSWRDVRHYPACRKLVFTIRW